MPQSQLQSEFQNQGYVFCPGFRATDQVTEILTNIDRVITSVVSSMPPEHVFYENKSDKSTLKQLQNLHQHDSWFHGLMTTGPFRALAEELLGSEVVCQNMQYFNKPPGIGQPTPPHQDGYYFKLDPCEALTMWMALEPVDAENGCVRYVPNSHQRGMRSHGSTGTLGFSQGITDFPTTEDSASEIGFPAQPGDLLAHHALTIHRADGNSSQTRTRRALGFIYYSVNAKEDLAAREKYQSELKTELKQTGKI